MKIINKQMHLTIKSINELLSIKSTKLYYVISREDDLLNANNLTIKKFPQAIIIGDTRYYNSNHIEIFERFINIADSYEGVRGKYEKAYLELDIGIDKIREMEKEREKAERELNRAS